MSDDAAVLVADTPTIDTELAPPQPIMSAGGDDATGTVPPGGADSSETNTAAVPMLGSIGTNVAGRASAGRTSVNPHSGRGRNTTDRGGGGRIPMGGRGLVMGARSGQSQGRGYGRGYNQPQQHQRMPIQVHANSGVPFGHVPAYLPGSSSLVEELDQRILLVLRDGKHIIGTLISFDQFGNLVLSNAIDRQIVSVLDKESGMKRNYYADLPLDGLYIARGESLVLVGEVHDESNNVLMQSVTLEELGNLSSNALPSLEWDFDTDLTA